MTGGSPRNLLSVVTRMNCPSTGCGRPALLVSFVGILLFWGSSVMMVPDTPQRRKLIPHPVLQLAAILPLMEECQFSLQGDSCWPTCEASTASYRQTSTEEQCTADRVPNFIWP